MNRQCVAVVSRRWSARYGERCTSTGSVRVSLGEWVCGSHHRFGWSRSIVDRRCVAAVAAHGQPNIGERCPFEGSVQLGDDWLCGNHFRCGYVHHAATTLAPGMAERARAVLEDVS